jgi:hypothetical protein
MNENHLKFKNPIHIGLLKTIKLVREKIIWKPGRGKQHLEKRQRRGHLPKEATLSDYEKLILDILLEKSSRVLLYWYEGTPFVAITGEIEGKTWLVIFDFDGIMESAFVVERPDRYLKKPGFEEICAISEVDDELQRLD